MSAIADPRRGNPFVGLRPFESEEAMLFFGRDEQTLELVERLAARRFLAVIGSSGCGKSSLVRAGLISRLKAGTLSAAGDRWHVASLKPGARPFAALTSALADGGPALSVADPAALAEELRTGGLTPLLGALAPAFADGAASLLLVVDQFEELFRFGLDSGEEASRVEASEFVALLLGLARQETVPVYVVITLRADFLGDCDAFRGLPEAINASQYLVPRLSRDRLREAIEGPARLYARRVAPRLVDRLLNDGGAERDQLPVLQHVLMRIWQVAGGAEVLDLEHYLDEKVGGFGKALSIDAGEALAELGQGEVAEKLFRELTTTDDRARQIRRPRTLAQLVAETGESQERMKRVIDVFRGGGRSFLMPPEAVTLQPETLIDISHESLIREWETLRGWVEAEAESGRVFRRLAEDARRYGEGKGSLLSGRTLEVARQWRREARPTAKWAERYADGFYQAMDFLAESERRERQRKRLTRGVQGALAGLLFLAVALGIFSTVQWRQARQKTFEANYNLALTFEEKAGAALARGTSAGTREALLYTLAALSEDVGKRRLPVSTGRLLTPDLRTEAFHEIWRSHLPAAVSGVAYSPDGKSIASGSDDGTLRIWDAESGEEVRAIFEGRLGRVLSVAYSPDGKGIASGSIDGTLHIWDVESGEGLATLTGHLGAVWSVAYSPDGKHIVSGSVDGIRLWDIESGASLTTLAGHLGWVLSVAYSPDGKHIASGSVDGTLRLWDIESGASLATLAGHSGWVLSVAYSPNGHHVASGFFDGTIRLWDVENGENLATLAGHSDRVSSVSYSPDGKRIVSGSDDRTLRLWDVESGGSLATFVGHSDEILSVAYSPDGKRIVSGSRDKTVRHWDAESVGSVGTLAGQSGGVLSVAYSPDSKLIASGSSDGTICFWSAKSMKSLATLAGHSGGVLSVAYSPDGKRIASGSTDRTIRLWDVENRENIVTLQGHSAWVLSVAYSPDGSSIASGSEDQTLRIWDVESRENLATLTGHSGEIWSVAYSPDGKYVASGSLDGTLRIWDLESGKSLVVFVGHSEGVRSVGYSPDGKYITSGSLDGTIHIWDAESGENLATLAGHSVGILSVVYSPDGKRIASGSVDGILRIWDVESGDSLATLAGHSDAIWSVVYSPDGKSIASGSNDRTVRLWYSELLPELVQANRRRSAIEKILHVSLDRMQLRRVGLHFEPIPNTSPSSPELLRPPVGEDLLEWLLESSE